MIERKEILRWAMLIAIVFAIIMQIRVTKLIYDNQETIETDPLVYAAKKYGLPNSCTCPIDEEKTIIFNQSGSWTQIKRLKEEYKFIQLNLSDLNLN